MNKLIIFLLSTVFLQSANISSNQLKKLKNPIVTIENNTLIIDKYNRITFTKPVLFSKKKVSEIIIKTKAIMKKNIAHKEQFIAISSVISSQMIQTILFSAEYIDKLETNELLSSKPLQNIDLNIKIIFIDKGLSIKIYSKYNNIEHFIPYNDIFLARMR